MCILKKVNNFRDSDCFSWLRSPSKTKSTFKWKESDHGGDFAMKIPIENAGEDANEGIASP